MEESTDWTEWGRDRCNPLSRLGLSYRTFSTKSNDPISRNSEWLAILLHSCEQILKVKCRSDQKRSFTFLCDILNTFEFARFGRSKWCCIIQFTVNTGGIFIKGKKKYENSIISTLYSHYLNFLA